MHGQLPSLCYIIPSCLYKIIHHYVKHDFKQAFILLFYAQKIDGCMTNCLDYSKVWVSLTKVHEEIEEDRIK